MNKPTNTRIDNRRALELRPITIECGINRYAEGSCIFTQGNTKVHCTATVENKVPKHIKELNNGSGWLTAEYAMLPRSTHFRSERERQKVNARASEIQRLIGRSLRAMVDLSKLGERTITVDCDVLQADAGTRCAAINGGAIAISLAINSLLTQNLITSNPIISLVGAISLVYISGEILLDPCYEEDSDCDLDLNLVGNANGGIIELQASTEGKAPSFTIIQEMVTHGQRALQEIFNKMADVY